MPHRSHGNAEETRRGLPRKHSDVGHWPAPNWRGPRWGAALGGGLLFAMTLCLSPDRFLLPSALAEADDLRGGVATSDLPPAVLRRLEQTVGDDPRAGLEFAKRLQQNGIGVPDDLLKKIVAAALHPDAPWSHAEAAIQFFDLYYDRPWLKEVLTPFLDVYAAQILLNATWFATLNPAWTRSAIEVAALQNPALVLQELGRIAQLDSAWAKQLAQRVAEATPALVFTYAEALLAVDRSWARRRFQVAARLYPHEAIRAIRFYIAEPWGQRLFEEAALADPRWTIGVAITTLAESASVATALQRSQDPRVHFLAQLAESDYPEEFKGRMAVFLDELAANTRSLDEAFRLSQQDRGYFSTLVTMQLGDRYRSSRAITYALKDEARQFIQRLNHLHDQPDALRFRTLEGMNARELYVLTTYGEDEVFTSTYRGIFDRMLSRMRSERITGEQLLEQVQNFSLRVFINAAATFNRLEAFLATLPSPVQRWSLIARSVRDIERAPEMTLEAVTAAEILGAPLDVQSLRLIRDTIKSEFARAELERSRTAMAIYGLLAARFVERTEPELRDAALTAIAGRYRAYLPTLHGLSGAKLFENARNVQRYFFYDDDDGQASFQSFLAQYSHSKAWSVVDHGAFIQIHGTVAGRQIDMYANKPTEASENISALTAHLQQHRLTPRVIVHRGHSYHVEVTIEHIPATAVLVFLGSCGGYTQLQAVLGKAPEAHVIATKGIAGVTVNDPLLKALNEYVLSGKELIWKEFWRHAEAILGGNSRFVEYVPPDKNASVIFLKAYRAVIDEEQRLAAYHQQAEASGE